MYLTIFTTKLAGVGREGTPKQCMSAVDVASFGRSGSLARSGEEVWRGGPARKSGEEVWRESPGKF